MSAKIKITNLKFSIDEIEISEQNSFKNFMIDLLEGLEKSFEKKEEKLRPEPPPNAETETTI